MPSIAMFFGFLLTALGITLFVMTNWEHYTALIPAFFGLAFIVLSFIARFGEKARMHAMHVAAMVALIGFAFPAYRVTMALMDNADMTAAVIGQMIMSALCFIFLVQCIKSFVDARRLRSRSAEELPR